jgi:putative NADPH-quinone reductase
MDVLVVNGFAADDPAPALSLVASWLDSARHQVARFDLAAEGFDTFLSAAEREAYHTDTPLISAPTRAAADAVLAARALIICYPIKHGTAPPRVKSWQERVFVLGLAFRFKPSGKITGALDHLAHTLVLGVGPAGEHGRAGGRNCFGPCLARSFVLSSNRTCRARYLSMEPGGSGRAAHLIERRFIDRR